MISSISRTNKREQRFRRLALLTIIIIYLLILAGGIVRATGSGMGCPDWPKCFDRWVPPTEISQLPLNYQEIYGAKLKGEVEFNAVKTWIEYINRLLGVLSGFFVFGTLLTSLIYLRRDNAIFWGSFIAFLFVGINGWLGSKVVSTELAQYMITLHLLLAIVVVFALLFVVVRSNVNYLEAGHTTEQVKPLRWLLFVVITLTLTQIILGTQVRDALDDVVKRLGYEQRANWINYLDWRFYIHRSFSLVVLVFHLAVVYQLSKVSKMRALSRVAKAIIALVITEIGTGVIMAYLGAPVVSQPIHLLVAVLLIGLQFVAWLLVNPKSSMSDWQNQKEQIIAV